VQVDRALRQAEGGIANRLVTSDKQAIQRDFGIMTKMKQDQNVINKGFRD